MSWGSEVLKHARWLATVFVGPGSGRLSTLDRACMRALAAAVRAPPVEQRTRTAFRCGLCGTTLCREFWQGVCLEENALTSTPVAMEVEAVPARSDAASMKAGAVIDVGLASPVPAASVVIVEVASL